LCVVPGLPKTRSGKIIRRILRAIANKEQILQDISTLEDPAIVEIIKSKII
jgi:acetyl-CoA synthetase